MSGEYHRHQIDPPHRGSEARRGTTHLPFLVVVEVLFGSSRPRCSRLDLDCDPLTAKLDQQVDLTTADPDVSVDCSAIRAIATGCWFSTTLTSRVQSFGWRSNSTRTVRPRLTRTGFSSMKSPISSSVTEWKRGPWTVAQYSDLRAATQLKGTVVLAPAVPPPPPL